MASQPTVFIVDDDKAVRGAVQLLCEVHGLVAESYASGGDFLDNYTPGRWGCLVLDLCMPGIDGLELQAQLSIRRINLPIIFITAYGSEDKIKHALAAGAIGVLEKPFQPGVLIKHIRRIL